MVIEQKVHVLRSPAVLAHIKSDFDEAVVEVAYGGFYGCVGLVFCSYFLSESYSFREYVGEGGVDLSVGA